MPEAKQCQAAVTVVDVGQMRCEWNYADPEHTWHEANGESHGVRWCLHWRKAAQPGTVMGALAAMDNG